MSTDLYRVLQGMEPAKWSLHLVANAFGRSVSGLTHRNRLDKRYGANGRICVPMAKQASSANPSVPLHEVLEAEFAVLHGKLPPDYPSSTEPNTRLKAIWAAVHELPEKRAALCISGGGIRSATFWTGSVAGPRSLRFARQVPLSLHRLRGRIHRQLAQRLD